MSYVAEQVAKVEFLKLFCSLYHVICLDQHKCKFVKFIVLQLLFKFAIGNFVSMGNWFW